MARPIEKRALIVDAALELFVEKGIVGTTIRDIAQRAGAAEGTMYRYFESKEVLAWQLFVENLSDFVKSLQDRTESIVSTEPCLRKMIQCFYDFFETSRTLYAFLLLSEHDLGRQLPDEFVTPISLLIDIMKSGQERGEVKQEDPSLLAAMVVGAVTRVSLFKIYGRIDRDLRDYVDSVHISCWNMIKA